MTKSNRMEKVTRTNVLRVYNINKTTYYAKYENLKASALTLAI